MGKMDAADFAGFWLRYQRIGWITAKFFDASGLDDQERSHRSI
jgi:hypothetical protein